MTEPETLRDAWYVAAYTSELEEKGMISTTLLGEPIVIYGKTDGSPVALEDRCVHRLAPLSLGRVEGDNLRCMYHGMLFSAEGAALEIPGQDLIPKRACVRSYPVVERSGWLWVWPGNPERADAALIPPVVGMRHPDWFLHEGLLDYNCSSDPIITNLIDLGHLTWVHRESFGADEAWAETVPTTSPIERGVRVTRWLREIPPIPRLGKAADHERVDHWASFDFYAPGAPEAAGPAIVAALRGESVDQPPQVAALLAYAERSESDPACLAAVLERPANPVLTEARLSAATAPILLLNSTDDAVAQPDARLRAALPGADHILIDGPSHVALTSDARFRDAAIAFLSR